jgi:hypothetical protein
VKIGRAGFVASPLVRQPFGSFRYLGERVVSTVVRYRSFLEGQAFSAATINLHLTAIRRVADGSRESSTTYSALESHTTNPPSTGAKEEGCGELR